MTETMTFAPAPSDGFARARKLSRIMAVLFTIGFWLSLAGAVLILATPLDPIIERGGHGMVGHGVVGINDITVSLEGLSVLQCIWVMLALEISIVPAVFLMHHTRRVFGHFAKDEIFVLPVIGHIRHAGQWLIISFFADIAAQNLLKTLHLMPSGPTHGSSWPLVIGVVTFIAAYVMEEARRIAADNAEIV